MAHHRSSRRRWLLLVAVALILLAVAVYAWLRGFPELNEEDIRRLTAENLVLLLLVMLAVMIFQNVVTIIPLVAVVSVNVALFGLPGGFLWSWLSSLAGASVAFAAARYWFQEPVTRRLNADWLARIEKNGYLFVFLARLFPFAPSNLINFTAGVSVVPFRQYLASTALGNFLFQLLVAVLVEGLLSDGAGQWVSLAVFAVLTVAVAGYRFYANKRKQG